MIKGNVAKLYFGKETEYASKANPSFKIKFASEDFKEEYEKKAEGLLTGSKISGRSYTMGIKGSGKVSTLARPDELGHFLRVLFGDYTNEGLVESGDYAGKYKHVFELVDGASALPTLTAWVDRGAKKYSYVGLTAAELELAASPGDFLKLDVTFNLKNENEETTITEALSYSTNKPLRFYHGKVKVEGVEVADITDMKYNHKNNAELKLQTTDTGIYYKQPAIGEREITLSFEALYAVASEAIKNSYFKTDDVIALELIFKNEDNDAAILTVPFAQITEYSGGTATGPDEMKVNYTVKAVDGETEPSLTLYNTRITDY